VVTAHLGNHKWWKVSADATAGYVDAHQSVKNVRSGIRSTMKLEAPKTGLRDNQR
jgi:hypothetical protein